MNHYRMIPLLILILILLAVLWSCCCCRRSAGNPGCPRGTNGSIGHWNWQGLKPGQKLHDLGSGDGRVLIAAARDFGARAVGVELSPLLFALAWVKIRVQRLHSNIRLRCGSYFQADIRDADVVYLYLTHGNANRLRSKLELEMKPGSRVVSVSADLEGWQVQRMDRDHLIFLYTIHPINK